MTASTRISTALLASTCALALAACSSTPDASSQPDPALAMQSSLAAASVNLAAASGSLVSGHLTLTPMADGVHLTGTVGGLDPSSVHGIHIHENGDCSAADASSAGGHFNPTREAHGKVGTPVHHGGDMINIVANAQGVASVDVHATGVVIGGAAANDVIGRAVIVHANPDDYTSQPSGSAGARVACGVIVAGR